MNLRDLRYLVALADLRHFGRAAEACHVSQPTLSMQLRKLEDYLDVPLLERNSRQVMLTPMGERIVEQARRVLREADGLLRMAKLARDPFSGELRLGIIPTVAPYLLPRILPRLRKRFPTLLVQLVESQTASLLRMLRGGEIEAAIAALPFDLDHTVQVPIYTEPFLLAVAKEHPKARRKTVELTDLDDEQVLLLEDGHCLRDQALAVCSSAGAIENANFSATSIETLRQMVGAGAGVTLMPQLAAVSDANVRYIPFRTDPPHRVVGMIWRDSSPRGEVLRSLADAFATLDLVHAWR